MPTVSGFIRNETGGPALGATVRAFDKDLRHVQRLGSVVITETSGRYEITYTPEQFRRAEKKTADLIVRAFDADDNLRAESEIRFNARETERIDLTFAPLPITVRPRLTELEELQESIEPVREGVPYGDFTDPDLTLLTEETIRAGTLGIAERPIVGQRLEFLRLADQSARATALPRAAFYGWFRQDQPRVLAELWDQPNRVLRQALETAISERIIPDIRRQIPDILERISNLRVEEGHLVRHRFVVQLINAATDRPLAGSTIGVVDLGADAGDQDLGTLFTDGRGVCSITFSLPRNAPDTATRQLQLNILDNGATVGEARVTAQPNQREAAVNRVNVREDERGDIPIEQVPSIPASLVARLREQGVRTLSNLLAHPEITDEDEEQLERLRANAKFSILAPGLSETEREHLLGRGFRSPLDIGATSRAEFVSNHHEPLGGDPATFGTHFAARETRKLFFHMVGSAWLKNVTTPDDEPPDPDIPTGVEDLLDGLRICGCKDCTSAVSPAAYLAHLLEWTLEHIKSGTASIQFSQLAEEFHQPFGDLPASCSAVETQVRQVRICVEALWRFTGFLDREDLQLPLSFRNAYRHLRNQLYRGILTNLGTSFEQLRRAVLQIPGDTVAAAEIAAQRQAIADLLGIDQIHLNELFFNIEQPPISPSEDELQQRFGYRSTRLANVFAPLSTPALITWQRQRLEAIWQEQDWSSDIYSGEDRLPFIDPALIEANYLRTPLDDNAAFALLEARRTELETHRQSLVDQQPQQNGLATLLENELESDIDELRNIFATLQSPDATTEQVIQAQEMIDAVNLTKVGFTHLMEIDAHQLAGEPIALTLETIEAAWTAAFDILSRAHRHTLFPTWIQEENDLELVFGPKLFWLAVDPAPPTNPWTATPSERVQWVTALADRSRRPIIDPDQIQANHIIVMAIFKPPKKSLSLGFTSTTVTPPLQGINLWQERRDWVDERLSAVQEARQDQGNSLATLEAVLQASTLGIDLETLEELANQEFAGQDIERRLTQLSLTMPEFRFLAGICELALGNVSVQSHSWQEVDAILIQAEKRREFSEWRIAEQAAGITLHPHRFVAPAEPEAQDGLAQIRWLHDPIALQQWLDTLSARGEQFKALTEGLAEVVGKAEESVLPLLRNILIMETNAPGNSFAARAEWMDRRLLIDMHLSGCQMTSRISQAIETLQRFIRGVYTQDHLDVMDHLTLDAIEDYEFEWPVLGSYATWRAFMLAYLYPENLLNLTPPIRQSHGHLALTKKLRNAIVAEQACEYSKAYFEYFRDICSLDIEATCQVEMVESSTAACKPTSLNLVQRTHLFGRSRETGNVYWAQLDPTAGAEDTMTTWSPLGPLGQVEKILGATLHNAGVKRYLLLFAETPAALLLRKYDLDDGRWLGVKKLDWPPGFENGILSGAVVQKRQSDLIFKSEFNLPTLVAVSVTGGVSYIRKLRVDAEGWDENDWFPLYGPSRADSVYGIQALIEIKNPAYAILANVDSQVRYRTAKADDLNPLQADDFEWKPMSPGSHRGGFVSPGESTFFSFFLGGGQTKYRAVELTPGEPEEDDSDYVFSDVTDFNENWFIPNIGVSLDDTNLYKFERYAPDFFIPRHTGSEPDWHPLEPTLEDGTVVPIALGSWHGDVYFTGSVLGLITRTLANFTDNFVFQPLIAGGDMPEFWEDPNDLYFYLFQQKYYGVQQFLDHIKNIDSVSYSHPTLGWWKYANDRIKELSVDNLTLADLVQKLLVNQLLHDKERWAPRNSSGGNLVFKQRPAAELNSIIKISDDDWTVAPHSGVEATDEEGNRRLTVIQMKDDQHSVAVRVPTTVTGNSLAATAKYELAPYGDGPFDSLPEQNASALQQRAEDTKNIYSLLKTAPPSVKSYLQEAYLLVPTLLAHRLQRSGFFAEALVWYRLVFDYLAPVSERKICFGLVEEQSLTLDYNRADDFLNDASNTHAIAATRKNTYTRHVLLLIIRCLIDYADALFARDTAEDNAQARELYRQALKLLESDVLTSGTSPCDDILGQLEVEVVAPAQLPLSQFKVALGQIGEPDRLRSVASSLATINQNTALQPIERLGAMRDLLVTTLRVLPEPSSFTAVLDAKRRVTRQLENLFAADGRSRTLLRSTQERRRDLAINRVLEIVSDGSDSPVLDVPWLRLARPAGSDRDQNGPPALALRTPPSSTRLATLMQIRTHAPLLSLTASVPGGFTISNGVTFNFCIPQNPVVTALRTRAANNLTKLRTCRNIAGFLRQVDLYGAPIGLGSGMVSPDGAVFSGIVTAAPTPYRYNAVIARAKELTAIAQQLEAGYQAALENAEREALSVLQAEQNIEMAQARVVLQDLRVTQATNEISMAQLQKSSAVLREVTYAGFISAGVNASETIMLNAYSDAAEAQKQAARARAASSVAQTVAAMAGAWSISGTLTGVAAFQNIAQSAAISATLAEAGFQERAINAEAQAQAASFQASFERRNDEWQLQQGLAALDVQIGDQQITLAQNQADIVQQERVIAGMEQTHAVDVLQFLLSKTFTEEMYRWIASVLEDAYRFFLQVATAMARLAEQQLAFERQQDPLKVVQSDYWKLPANPVTGGTADRLGLTGSARLLKDIFQLDNYAFETRRRKQALTITLDLAEMFPLEFQRFRETGVLIFNTPLSLIDRQFPGYFLCLIQQVTLTVAALVPPTRGIRATCTSSGISRAVVGGDTFQSVTIRNLPERIAMTAATTSSSVMELEPDNQSMLNPFEGTGLDTLWELRMPKAANPFDYNTIATVLFTVNMTALHSFDYEREVIERFERKVSFDRAFAFRQVFADAWYDLNNPDQTATPMVVRFETRRSDFPLNLSDLAIDHVVLYLVRSDGEVFEQPIRHLHFTAEGSPGAAGGPASTVDGRVSTRSGNGVNWLSMIGQEPVGVWTLAFPDQPPADTQARDRFANEQIEDLLLVLTISGETASFPLL